MKCLAAAKVNLDLRITGRRDNGYHELDSLVVFPQIGDRLTFEAAPTLSLEIEGPQAGVLRDLPPQENLVFRAAQRLRDSAGIQRGARICLTKNLPVAAGLGGGSADAAACLSGLVDFWDLEIAPAELLSIALELGADVPVCLRGVPCFLTGIGEAIQPLAAFPALWMAVVNPGVELSTPQVFAAFDGSFSMPREALKSGRPEAFDSRDALLAALTESSNDLEPAAIGAVPEIAQCLTELRAAPGCLLARMSGSGASCFGLFASPEEASSSVRQLKTSHPDWWADSGAIGPG